MSSYHRSGDTPLDRSHNHPTTGSGQMATDHKFISWPSRRAPEQMCPTEFPGGGKSAGEAAVQRAQRPNLLATLEGVST